jgi:imidazoleglycerol-phosphate dehydratase
MKIAFILYNGMSSLDFIGSFDPLTRLKTGGYLADLVWETCALTPQVQDGAGLTILPSRVGGSLEGFDLLVIPGGPGASQLSQEAAFVDWLKSAAGCCWKASSGSGALLSGAAGFLQDKPAAADLELHEQLGAYTQQLSASRLVEAGDVITAAGSEAAHELGLYLVGKIAGDQVLEKMRRQLAPDRLPIGLERHDRREARVVRSTKETQIQVELVLDGRGQVQVDTGIGFFDHMLTHIGVHGLFDLRIQAHGDLHIDPHHTIEDVALALGKAFDQALGTRAGIQRIAHAYVPMDEALAFVAIDLSGRPYTIIEIPWRTPITGGIPTSLFDHFLESFASAARCNLHARIYSGRDDHHQAEAIFKALGRALDGAVQIDPRRAGVIPSTKGTLTV